MIEQGIVGFIQSRLGTPPITTGGFATQLPKDYIGTNPGTQVRSAWVWRSSSNPPNYALEGLTGPVEWGLCIDCHGISMVDAMTLAAAIQGVLDTANTPIMLSDTDSTFVQGIFRTAPFIDGYSDLNRSFVRMLEYKIIYNR